MSKIHDPVLVREVLKLINPQNNESLLDVTAGYGGHSSEILAKTGNFKESYLIDRDAYAINYLKNVIYPNKKVNILKNDFLRASQELFDQNKKFDIIFADLGVSSQHINDQDRGFSFMSNARLDMRMDQSQEIDAEYIINKYSESDLKYIIQKYGEEPKAAFIAKEILRNRPIKSTEELVKICRRAWPGYSIKNPATRTFQAIRIEVNQELKQLEETLPIWFNLLNQKGRLAIVTFHSLEDKIVKNFFKENSGSRLDDKFKLLTKKPIVPDKSELVSNPRARSAKLRAVVKK